MLLGAWFWRERAHSPVWLASIDNAGAAEFQVTRRETRKVGGASGGGADDFAEESRKDMLLFVWYWR